MKNAIVLLLGIIFIQACSSTKNETYWVSGIKTECSGGAGKMECLNVHKGKELDDENWENFSANIEGFEFEEGYMKKIEIKKEQLEKKDTPADASSIKYTMVKELEKKADNRLLMNGSWILGSMNDAPINRSIVLPTLEIDIRQKRISGSGGCNTYTSRIEKLGTSAIDLGNVASTRKACINKNIENDYYQALRSIKTYKIEGESLVFYNEEGGKILSYLKQDKKLGNTRLHDIWVVTRMDGNPVNRATILPRMEINLTEMTVMGNDGCNEYSGSIKEVSDSALVFGAIASTKKMCRDMKAADSFNLAMNNVTSYQLKDLNLMLMDKDGKEVLAFLKVD